MDSISDSVTKLNTQLNKSMVLMEDAVDTPSQNHKRKSITINTKTQPPSAPNSPAVKSRKSILKKSDKSFDEDSTNNGGVEINASTEELNNVTSQRLSSSTSASPRPRTVRRSLIIFLIIFNKLYRNCIFLQLLASRNS